jgi:hypothetical protein
MYDPKNPASIFEGDNLWQLACGISNAHNIKKGYGGDVTRPDLGISMCLLSDAEQELQRKGFDFNSPGPA